MASLADGVIYVGSYDGYLTAIDTSNAKQSGDISLETLVLRHP
jgi:hypothetical protein